MDAKPVNQNQIQLFNATWLLITVLLVLPIWLVDYLPLVDYPNHLARGHILRNFHDDVFRHYFTLDLKPLPNVALDLFLLATEAAISEEWAGRLFVTITMILFSLGIVSLGRQLRKTAVPWVALFVLTFAFNSALIYGFVNYCFGLSVFFVSFSLWLRWRSALTTKRFILLSALSGLAFFSHLTSVGSLWVSAGLISSLDIRSVGFKAASSRLVALAWLPVALAAVFMTTAASHDPIVWNSLYGKAVAAFGFIRSYSLNFDFAALGVLLSVLLYLMWSQGPKSFANAVLTKYPSSALLGVAFVILFLLMPRVILSSWAADARLVVPATVFILFTLPFLTPNQERKVVFGALLPIGLAKIIFISGVWFGLSKDISNAVSLLGQIPRHSRVYPVSGESKDGADENKKIVALYHVGHYATIHSDAFLPNLFALKGQQPLVFKNPEDSEPRDSTAESLSTYDYVFAVGGVPRSIAAKVPLQLVEKNKEVALYRVSAR